MSTKLKPMTTYRIDLMDGSQVDIDIPSSWKVTFGPLLASGSSYHNSANSGNCLRIYESKDKQRAIFTNVRAFRDLSIPVKVLLGDPNEDKTTPKLNQKVSVSPSW